jgi:homoprotocatechuate degradation regulator HpaR
MRAATDVTKPRTRGAGAPAREAEPERIALGIRRSNLPLLMLQAREHVIGRFRPILNAHGLTEQQWRIVRALLDTGPLEPREIVALCGISSPSLAGVLARMEEIGLVARERFDTDQRRVRVSLTARSRTLARRMAPALEAAYVAIEQQVGADALEQLQAALANVIAALETRNP